MMKSKNSLKSKTPPPNYQLMLTFSLKTKSKNSPLYLKTETPEKMLMPKPPNGTKTPPITTDLN